MRVRTLISAVLLIIVMINGAYLGAQQIEYVNSFLFRGDFFDIKIVDEYAYCAGYKSFHIYEIINSDSLCLIGGYPLPGNTKGIDVRGNLAYVCTSSRSFHIIDITNPGNPIPIGMLESNGALYKVIVQGDYAYLAAYGGGLQVVNIADPTNPYHVGTYPSTRAEGLFVDGNIAYVANSWEGSLKIIDISTPSDPLLIGNLDTPDHCRSVFVKDSVAFVACKGAGLLAVSISDPANPAILSTFDTPGSASDVFIFGNYAYVADLYFEGFEGGLQIIDISDPTNMIGYSYLSGLNGLGTVFVSGMNAFTGGIYLNIIDIADPTNPDILYQFIRGGKVFDVFAENGIAYVTGDRYTLSLIDIQNPFNLNSIYYPDTISVGTEIIVKDSIALISNSSSGFSILNVENTSNPLLISSLDIGGWTGKFAVNDTMVYLTTGEFYIIDISDALNPQQILNYSTIYPIMDVYISGSFAYLVYTFWDYDIHSGLEILDISDPDDPYLVGQSLISGLVYSILVNGDYAYIGGSLLNICNISDPTNPLYIDYQNPEGQILDMKLVDNFLFTANDEAGIKIYDISENPQNPLLMYEYDTPGNARRIDITEEYIYVADLYSMLILIYDLETGIINELSGQIRDLHISENYPNPFNPTTIIRFSLPEQSEVALTIYNILGQQVATLFEGVKQAGEHTITWNADDFPSGIYFARLESGESSKNIKMLLLK